MKATDLMIGDWVKCTDPRCEGHQVDLIDLSNEEVGLDGEIDNFENIIPIPITPEILEKNGFNKDIGGEDLWVNEFASINLNGTNFEIEVLGDNRNYDGEISYVHELQHTLRLCDIEKEIVV